MVSKIKAPALTNIGQPGSPTGSMNAPKPPKTSKEPKVKPKVPRLGKGAQKALNTTLKDAMSRSNRSR